MLYNKVGKVLINTHEKNKFNSDNQKTLNIKNVIMEEINENPEFKEIKDIENENQPDESKIIKENDKDNSNKIPFKITDNILSESDLNIPI